MFTLRTIHPYGEEQNIYLGSCYKTTFQEKSLENFNSYLETQIGFYPSRDDVYGFLTPEYGDVIPLIYGHIYYVVNENGKTFQKLTYKDPKKI